MQQPEAIQIMSCAACGSKRVVRTTTFTVSYSEHQGEHYICEGCWFDGSNGGAWNQKITERIIRRQRAEPVTTYRFPFLQATGKPSNINLTASLQRAVFIDVPGTQKLFARIEKGIGLLSANVQENERKALKAKHEFSYRTTVAKQSRKALAYSERDLQKAAYALARASRGATVTLLDGREFDVQIEGHVLVFQERSRKRKRK